MIDSLVKSSICSMKSSANWPKFVSRNNLSLYHVAAVVTIVQYYLGARFSTSFRQKARSITSSKWPKTKFKSCASPTRQSPTNSLSFTTSSIDDDGSSKSLRISPRSTENEKKLLMPLGNRCRRRYSSCGQKVAVPLGIQRAQPNISGKSAGQFFQAQSGLTR